MRKRVKFQSASCHSANKWQVSQSASFCPANKWKDSQSASLSSASSSQHRMNWSLDVPASQLLVPFITNLQELCRTDHINENILYRNKNICNQRTTNFNDIVSQYRYIVMSTDASNTTGNCALVNCNQTYRKLRHFNIYMIEYRYIYR